MKKTKKQMKIIIIVLILIFLMSVIVLYKNHNNQIIKISSNAEELYIVNLSESTCKTTTVENVTNILNYNGNADTVVINENTMSGDIITLDSKAFLQCNNLENILIDKSLIDENLEIENFKINTDYKDEKYVEYINTQEYSEVYQQYLKLSEEEKSKIELIPPKYDVPMSVLYSQNMEENYSVSQIDEANIPESFDLRDKINIKVENQDPTGTCYAYASLTSVETNLALLHNDYVDLSEVHMAGMTTRKWWPIYKS